VQVSGDKVTRWSDLSGNSRYVDQADATLQPTYVKVPWAESRSSTSAILRMAVCSSRGCSQRRRGHGPQPQHDPDGVPGLRNGFGHNGFLLGSNTNYHSTGPAEPDLGRANGWASANIRNGSTYLNRVKVDGTQTVLPTDYSIVSVVTTANVEADTLTKDRTYRTGGIKLGELLIYTRALSTKSG